MTQPYAERASLNTCHESFVTSREEKKVMSSPVAAVVVTYQPELSAVENLSTILSQVQALVVVDNGSRREALDPIRAASTALGFHLIENGENLGIAHALNQGVQWARSQGMRWVILFDQDSSITASFMDFMFEVWRRHPERDRVGSVHPKYIDPRSGHEPQVWRAPDGGPVRSLTSGALLPMWIFEKVGLFASEFFIDEVDTEFCFRIRASGYLIADSRDAVLHHRVGDSQAKSVLGFSFLPTHHNAVRRYYMTRNRVVLFRRYFRKLPRWVCLSVWESLRETVKCLIVERDRARKLRSILIGSRDGLTGRMGKYVSL